MVQLTFLISIDYCHSLPILLSISSFVMISVFFYKATFWTTLICSLTVHSASMFPFHITSHKTLFGGSESTRLELFLKLGPVILSKNIPGIYIFFLVDNTSIISAIYWRSSSLLFLFFIEISRSVEFKFSCIMKAF